MKKSTYYLLFCLLGLLHMKISAQSIQRTVCDGNMVRLDSLLQHTDINITDDSGRSLLHWAVACKQKETFDFLVQKGIRINVADNQEQTPMHVAVRFGNLQYFELLLRLQPSNQWISNYGASLMEKAVLNKDTVFVKKLIQSGIAINGANERGNTALEISERIGAKKVASILRSLGADDGLVRMIKKKGNYMGESAPDTIPKMFAPNFISTEEQEFGSIFNSTGTEFYFGVDRGGTNEIRYSKMVDGLWSKPETLLSHELYSYNDPFLSNDQKRLYFISKRPFDSVGKPKDVDIWYIQKSKTGWSDPINAGPEINTTGDEYYISFTDTGTLYFASNGHNPDKSDHDIYSAALVDGVYQKPVALSDAINTENYEADVFIAPDASYMIFCSTREEGLGRGDLYISFKTNDGQWSEAVNMGDTINTPYYEYCPFVTKDGKYLFYTSNQDIYWVSTAVVNRLKGDQR